MSAEKSTQPTATNAADNSKYDARITGGGAAAQGKGAVAVGRGGVFVGGDNTGNINVTIHDSKAPVAAPFQAPPPAKDQVLRTQEIARLKQHLLNAADELLPSTVGLHGFGGVGKTSLARQLCADPAVRAACRDGILWIELGKTPAEPRAQIADLVVALRGDGAGCATLAGARAQLQAALAERKTLLVLDDVWDEGHISDLLDASADSARLITTRNVAVLPFDAILVDLQVMAEQEAVLTLAAGLPLTDRPRLTALAGKLGYWPVLLQLTNRSLRYRILRQKTPALEALDTVNRELDQKGVVAFDPAHHVSQRDQAVAATVDASLEMLDPSERQRFAELAIFPQEVALPLARAAQLWELTAGLTAEQSAELIASRIEPLSLLTYDGTSKTLRLHDVLRSYVYGKLTNKSALHQNLAALWGERPASTEAYAWRWLAYHRAQAAIMSPQPERHGLTEKLLAVVTDVTWQAEHERALNDLPALREALMRALDAAVADDTPQGVALLVQAADALGKFNRDYLRPEPIFATARQGDLEAAKRRAGLFAIDDHWRQALLLTIAWLAPPHKRAEARKLCDEIAAEPLQESVRNLLSWVRADLFGDPAPVFPFPVHPGNAGENLIEQLIKRVGGSAYNREMIATLGLDANAQNPDMPEVNNGVAQQGGTTRYLAELDGPYLVAYAAKEPDKGKVAFERYLSVYTNYAYAEYRFSSLWLVLGFVVRLPRADGAFWVRDQVEKILISALAGGSVEFDQGLAIAATALRAQAGDGASRHALMDQAHRLIDEAMHIKPGRDREGSDIWAHHKRLMLAHAQALGWLLGETALAEELLQQALDLADSGFAGYQAPACWALAEAFHICRTANAQKQIDAALALAQSAADNVQDPSFCARMTARVNALRQNWWQGVDLAERVRRLAEAPYLPDFAALHRVGHSYEKRRPGALKFEPWVRTDSSFDNLLRLYQRPKADFLRLNGGEPSLKPDDAVAVPDRGFVPHIAARLAAEILAHAGAAPLTAQRLQLLRTLVPYAVLSPTALDAVLSRLVLAQARGAASPELAAALDAALARRPKPKKQEVGSELTTARLPA